MQVNLFGILKNYIGIQQQNINLREINDDFFPTRRHGYSGLWLVELHRNENDIKNRFGDGVNGPTQESLENLNWVPCGEPVSLINSFGRIRTRCYS